MTGTPRRLLVLCLSALAAFSAPIAAQMGPLARNSPYERFNDKDMQMFQEQNNKTLNEAPDNQTMSWENPDTRSRGDFTILKTFQKDGNTCKEMRVRAEAGGRKGDTVLNWCKIEGKWRLLSSSQLQ
jgi:surface antigen